MGFGASELRAIEEQKGWWPIDEADGCSAAPSCALEVAMNGSKTRDDDVEAVLEAVGTEALLRELGRRLGVAYGRVEVTFHDRAPAPRIVVEHRLHKTVADS